MTFAASDIADWWDQQHRDAKVVVDQFVDENPNLFGVVVGTALVTSMELGACIPFRERATCHRRPGRRAAQGVKPG